MKLIKIFTSLIVVSLLFAGCDRNRTADRDGNNATPSATATTATQPSPQPIPENWETFSDDVAGYSMAYPPEWNIDPANRFNGESTITSFSPEDIERPGPVSSDQLKVAVIRFLPDSQINIDEPAQEEIIEESTIIIAGKQATRRVVSGMTESVQISFSDNGAEYQISAFPANSQYIDTFDQMISSFSLIPAVSLSSPESMQVVSSPIQVTGQAPGTWFFEGQIQAVLVDQNDNELGSISIQTKENWMTESAVNFSGQLPFTPPSTGSSGELIIRKENPSGLPENEREVRMTVRFN